ncbi:hypothetical protein, partial [Klebsiella quasipneumoniae]
ALCFITRRFSQWRINTLFILAMTLLMGVAVALPLTDTKYLMVSLKNAPQTPSFYLSEDNVKFGLWSDARLTVDQCRTSA